MDAITSTTTITTTAASSNGSHTAADIPHQRLIESDQQVQLTLQDSPENSIDSEDMMMDSSTSPIIEGKNEAIPPSNIHSHIVPLNSVDVWEDDPKRATLLFRGNKDI